MFYYVSSVFYALSYDYPMCILRVRQVDGMSPVADVFAGAKGVCLRQGESAGAEVEGVQCMGCGGHGVPVSVLLHKAPKKTSSAMSFCGNIADECDEWYLLKNFYLELIFFQIMTHPPTKSGLALVTKKVSSPSV